MKPIPRRRTSAGELLIRSLLFGAIYAAAHVLGAATLGSGTTQQPLAETAALSWFSGTVLGLAFAPFILHSTWTKRDTVLATWAAIAFVRSAGTGIEGAIFVPRDPIIVAFGIALDLVASLLFAWLAVMLVAPAEAQRSPGANVHRPWWAWAWRVLLVGLAYCLFYFVFGATNALLYTRSFYENNPQYGLNLPPVGVLFVAQMIRGPLFGLGALFILRATDIPRRQTAVWLGLLLFVLGGLGPYVEAVFRSMPLGFNVATLTELLLQNFCTGVVAAFLYKPAAPATA